VYYSFKHAIPAIRRAGGGAMTATASTAAHRGYPNLPAYCSSKGAVVALVRAVAADLQPTIRVNAVSAGQMATELDLHTLEAKGLAPGEAAVSGAPPATTFRRSYPIEVAHAHLFLVSDESSFVVGQALMVDGGRSIVPG
jgi:NAD(P)-dependent dehydrogenase (short-subunit alcohol dehydrogenase family)